MLWQTFLFIFPKEGRLFWHDYCLVVVCMVLKKKNKKEKSRLDDVIKAMRRGNREGQQEVMGPGFHSSHSVHRSKKAYTRKAKHKGSLDE